MIRLENISVRYLMTYDRIKSAKEYLVQWLRGKIRYEEFWALRGISFEVKKGEVLGIIGSNGAGKSTLLKVISGILKPTEGSVAVGGTVVPMLEYRGRCTNTPAPQKTRPQFPLLYPCQRRNPCRNS